MNTPVGSRRASLAPRYGRPQGKNQRKKNIEKDRRIDSGCGYGLFETYARTSARRIRSRYSDKLRRFFRFFYAYRVHVDGYIVLFEYVFIVYRQTWALKELVVVTARKVGSSVPLSSTAFKHKGGPSHPP